MWGRGGKLHHKEMSLIYGQVLGVRMWELKLGAFNVVSKGQDVQTSHDQPHLMRAPSGGHPSTSDSSPFLSEFFHGSIVSGSPRLVSSRALLTAPRAHPFKNKPRKTSSTPAGIISTTITGLLLSFVKTHLSQPEISTGKTWTMAETISFSI